MTDYHQVNFVIDNEFNGSENLYNFLEEQKAQINRAKAGEIKYRNNEIGEFQISIIR